MTERKKVAHARNEYPVVFCFGVRTRRKGKWLCPAVAEAVLYYNGLFLPKLRSLL